LNNKYTTTFSYIFKFPSQNLVLSATEGLKKLGKSGSVARKLQAIIAAKKYGITRTAEFYTMNKKTLIQWIKELKQKSLKGLEVQAGRGRKPLVTAAQEIEIKKWISENCNITINQLRLMILENMSVNLSSATVHRIMQRLKFSYITPRPRHYKQDQNLKNEFKKKSSY
jgi:transposase